MKQHPFRLAAGLASTVLVGGLLAGCAPAAESNGNAGGEKTSTVTELTIPTAESPWLDGYKKMAAQYEAETGVKINLTTFPFDGLLTQQANAAQSGSNAFDLFQINEVWVGQFYDNGWVQPLTDVDPDFTWDENLMSFDGVGQWDKDARITTPDGVAYSLPMNGNIQLFMYRTDIYEELGLTVPTTWDEVLANGKKAREAGVVDSGYVLRGKAGAGATFDFSSLLFSEGGEWLTDPAGGDWTPSIDTAEAKRALTMYRDLAAIGPDAPQTIGQAEATALMQSGSVMASTLVVAVAAPLEDPNASTVAGKIGYALVPGEQPVTGTWTLGIPTGLPADRAAAAYDFMTWLTSQQTQQTWVENGGVTVRTDLESDRPEIVAQIESAEYAHSALRYSFTPDMIAVTDPIIGEVVAGTKSVDDAIAEMQAGVTKVVQAAGFLK